MKPLETNVWKQPEAHFGANDSDVIDWVIFALYLIAAMFSLRTAFISRAEKKFAQLWGLISLGTFLLGLNKQLDLQTWLLRTGRRLAESEHIFKYRLVIHFSFFLVVVCVISFFAIRWAGKIKAFARQFQLATAGCALIGAYVLTRAVNINHIDRLVGLDLENVVALWLLELVGLTMLIAETLRFKASEEKAKPLG